MIDDYDDDDLYLHNLNYYDDININNFIKNDGDDYDE